MRGETGDHCGAGVGEGAGAVPALTSSALLVESTGVRWSVARQRWKERGMVVTTVRVQGLVPHR